jgi:hypothetical protein
MSLAAGTKLGPYEIEPLGRREPVLSEAEGSRPAKSRAQGGIAC